MQAANHIAVFEFAGPVLDRQEAIFEAGHTAFPLARLPETPTSATKWSEENIMEPNSKTALVNGATVDLVLANRDEKHRARAEAWFDATTMPSHDATFTAQPG